MNRTDPIFAALDSPWRAIPNEDMGGWRVVAASGIGVADLVLDRRLAERIADVHNAQIAGSAVDIAEGQRS